MKMLVSLFAVLLVSQSAFAAKLSPADHKALYELLIGKSTPAKLKEQRVFFFAEENDVLTVFNSAGSIGLSVGSIDISFGDEDKIEYLNAEKSQILVTNFHQEMGAKEIYSTTKIEIDMGYVSLTYTEFWSYDYSGDKGVWVRLAQPKVTQLSAGGELRLSYTAKDSIALGKRVAKLERESRDAGVGYCKLESQYILKCEWSLETDYADDTLRGTFLVKDRKVRQVLATEIEWGC